MSLSQAALSMCRSDLLPFHRGTRWPLVVGSRSTPGLTFAIRFTTLDEERQAGKGLRETRVGSEERKV